MIKIQEVKKNTFLFLKFYFIFKLYIIVLVLPNIKMNPPQVYMCNTFHDLKWSEIQALGVSNITMRIKHSHIEIPLPY